ncbi:hypothetical protein AYX22_17805 [Arthrobacter sp. D5-1]|nr:hypothetical protein AYX22_17805 [Arthrobacter sp. D5-1]
MTKVHFNEERLNILVPDTGSELNIQVWSKHLTDAETVRVVATSLALRNQFHNFRTRLGCSGDDADGNVSYCQSVIKEP